MAEITKIQTFLEEEEDENQDNDLVNIDLEEQYSFNFHPFFTPSSSSSSSHNHQVISKSSSSSSSCCCLSEPESETHYPDCLFAYNNDNDDEYDHLDYVTDLFQETRFSVNNDDNYRDHELELGLRATGIESESDVEELTQVNDGNEDTHDVNLDRFWECPFFDTDRIVDDERNEQEGLSSVIDRIEEIPVSSEMSSDGDASVGLLEWEVFYNNLERDFELETDGGEGGFVYTPEFDTLIGQFVETVRALRGSPPAAKSFVDSLPLVVLKKGGFNEVDDHEICAVCKDEILIEEKVTQLPCRHHYHGECIVPWLSIRNTCPVCRFELPTDDVDYERNKNRENDDDELRVRSGFELSP